MTGLQRKIFVTTKPSPVETSGRHRLRLGHVVMRDVLRITVIVASAVVFSIRADVSDADSLTLADIRERCVAPEGSEEFAFCRGYVAALVEGVIVKHHPDCIPPMVNDYQFALLMRKYLNANPENPQLPAVDGVLSAIAEMFKCNTKGSK